MSRPFDRALAESLFYLDPDNTPFTHIMSMQPRWTRGEMKCLVLQGYKEFKWEWKRTPTR